MSRALEKALKIQRNAVSAFADKKDPQSWSAVQKAAVEVTYLDQIVERVLDQASYRRLRTGYTIARIGMLAGAVLASAGIAAFAWAANPPKPTEVPVVVATPTKVDVQLTRSGAARLRHQFGRACNLSTPVTAVAVSDIGSGYELATIATATCPAVVITVGRTDAVVTPAR